MYEQFFGFREKPFSVTPDTSFFFSSERHEEALNTLLYSVNERKGFVVITGEIGCGKTTVWHVFLNRLDKKAKIAVITNSFLTPKQIIMAILEEFEIPYKEQCPKIKLINILNKYLIEQITLGFNIVLVIDEAQNLSFETLEEIRMLSNVETEKEKLIQIVLIGQPELKDILGEKKLEQFRQRISLYYHIHPLTEGETKNYIEHRLSIAGANGGAGFSDYALMKIHMYSGGVPRRINNICDRALLTGFIRERQYITEDIIDEVSEELDEIVEQKIDIQSRI